MPSLFSKERWCCCCCMLKGLKRLICTFTRLQNRAKTCNLLKFYCSRRWTCIRNAVNTPAILKAINFYCSSKSAGEAKTMAAMHGFHVSALPLNLRAWEESSSEAPSSSFLALYLYDAFQGKEAQLKRNWQPQTLPNTSNARNLKFSKSQSTLNTSHPSSPCHAHQRTFPIKK